MALKFDEYMNSYYQYGGAHTVSVAPIAGVLVLDTKKKNPETGVFEPLSTDSAQKWNYSVQINVSTNAEEGVSMPLVLQRWSFVPDGRVTDSLTINQAKQCSLASSQQKASCVIQVWSCPDSVDGERLGIQAAGWRAGSSFSS